MKKQTTSKKILRFDRIILVLLLPLILSLSVKYLINSYNTSLQAKIIINEVLELNIPKKELNTKLKAWNRHDTIYLVEVNGVEIYSIATADLVNCQDNYKVEKSKTIIDAIHHIDYGWFTVLILGFFTTILYATVFSTASKQWYNELYHWVTKNLKYKIQRFFKRIFNNLLDFLVKEFTKPVQQTVKIKEK